MKSWFAHMGQQGIRVVLLVAIVVGSGIGLGLAAGVPLSRINFEESDAVRLDQEQLEGEVDPAAALVTIADMPLGWEPGDPAVAGLGILGSGFCGIDVPLPSAVDESQATVFSNPAEEAYLVSEAVRVESWQAAVDYVDEMGGAVGSCEEYYQQGLTGERVKYEIRDGGIEGPISDHVTRTLVAEDGSALQSWSVMAVGDVVVAIQYLGPARPQEGFLEDLELKVLGRLDPEDFGSSSTTTTVDPTATSVVDGGPADESEADPLDVEGGEPTDGADEPGP